MGNWQHSLGKSPGQPVYHVYVSRDHLFHAQTVSGSKRMGHQDKEGNLEVFHTIFHRGPGHRHLSSAGLQAVLADNFNFLYWL